MMKTERAITLAVTIALVALAAMACGGRNSTPTKTWETFSQAVNDVNPEAYKSCLSRPILEDWESKAREAHKSVNEMIMNDLLMTNFHIRNPETRNETVSGVGQMATLEVKDTDHPTWRTIDFVKESDGWKIAK